MNKNIIYVGSSGTSGYAISTKNQIFNYLMHGNNVTYIPLSVDNSNKNDIDIISKNVDSCINKIYENYDLFIYNFIPDKFDYILNAENQILSEKIIEKINKPQCKKILKTVWETTKISSTWVDFINNSVCDEVWLPSEFNKKAFIECGVKKIIKVDKYISYNFIQKVEKTQLFLPEHIQYGEKNIKDTYNFYYIATWNERKNNKNTIRSFFETFSKDDNVSLIMKTNDYEYTSEKEQYIKQEIEDLLKQYPNHPTVVWFPKNYNAYDMSIIHNLGDCYYLLHRGEGLGYSSYDAYLNHKPVIVTGYGGHTEYFSDKYPYFVEYSMTPVFGMDQVASYQHTHDWAEPDYNHARNLLKFVYEKYNCDSH
jgi:hypothetical protein